MQLNPVIEKFYLSILKYAGLEFSNNIIKNENDRLGEITIDNKNLTLPYFNNLKNPEGKVIFHILNENYTNPETTVFDFYKKRLVLELNLKLSYTVINLISIASDAQMQQKIRSSKLIDIISNIGEVDHSLIESFLNLTKASKKVNGESYIFDIFLKKNGKINDVPYSAIGKINFILPNEISKSLEDKEREYKVYNYKLRKKDLIALNNIFNIIFPEFNDTVKYSEGTDNKIFRYLNILLKTSYMVADRINEIVKLMEELKEPTLNLEASVSDLSWANQLEELYNMSNEIRLIPNQTDISIESHRLKVDESKANVDQPSQMKQEFNPANIPNNSVNTEPTQYNTNQYQQPAPMQPKQLTPEEIIKGSIMSTNTGMGMIPNIGNVMGPGMMPMNPNMTVPVQNTYTPSWVIQETMKNNMNQSPNMMGMQPNMMQNFQPNMMGMQPNMMQNFQPNMMGMQPNMMQNFQPNMMGMQPNMMGMQPNMMGMPQQSGLSINPMFMGNRGGNFS